MLNAEIWRQLLLVLRDDAITFTESLRLSLAMVQRDGVHILATTINYRLEDLLNGDSLGGFSYILARGSRFLDLPLIEELLVKHPCEFMSTSVAKWLTAKKFLQVKQSLFCSGLGKTIVK